MNNKEISSEDLRQRFEDEISDSTADILARKIACYVCSALDHDDHSSDQWQTDIRKAIIAHPDVRASEIAARVKDLALADPDKTMNHEKLVEWIVKSLGGKIHQSDQEFVQLSLFDISGN